MQPHDTAIPASEANLYNRYVVDHDADLFSAIDKAKCASGHKWVYFIRDLETGLIKIGCSQDVQKRLLQVHYEISHPLELLGYIPGSHTIEQRLHQRFSRQRRNGLKPSGAGHTRWEWFEPSPEMMEYLTILLLRYG
jgi:hypothetical protein